MLAHRLDAEHRRALEVGRADLARVPRREDVVQRDEAELARMRRRAGDDHAARLEQRGETPRPVGRTGVAAGSPEPRVTPVRRRARRARRPRRACRRRR